MSDLARAARILTALAQALDETGMWHWDTIDPLRSFGSSAADQRPAAALLDAARHELAQPRTLSHADLPRVYDLCARVCGAEDATVAGHFLGQLRDLLGPPPAPRPRVWLPGDTVPAGVWVQDVDGGLRLSGLVECDEGPYVEVQTPSESTMAAAVAAEQARRAEEGHVQCVHCGEPIRKLSQIHCLNCGNPWDGD